MVDALEDELLDNLCDVDGMRKQTWEREHTFKREYKDISSQNKTVKFNAKFSECSTDLHLENTVCGTNMYNVLCIIDQNYQWHANKCE